MTIAFVHVPKTGGTSYGAILSGLIPGPHLMLEAGPRTAERFQRTVDPEELRRFSLVAGHFDFALCRQARFMEPVTLLRDPIDRIVSTYNDNLRGDRQATARWREFFVGRKISLVDFLRDDELLDILELGQVKQMAGFLWSDEPCPMEPAVLEIAKQNLESCVHVGIFERLEDSVRLMSAELSLAPVEEIPHLNASGRSPLTLPPDVVERLEERYAVEIAFHRWATSHFEERMAACGLEPNERSATSGRAQPDVTTDRQLGPADDPTTTNAGVGDWVSLAWDPPPRTLLGAQMGDEPSMAVLPIDRVTGQRGASFMPEVHAEVSTGLNWLRVPSGLYQMEASIVCAPEGWPETREWVVSLALFWCASPPFPSDPFVPGVPGRPDVVLPRFLTVPSCLPTRPGSRAVPLFASGLLRAPLDDGHLCLMMGSNLPIHASEGDRVTLLLVRIA